MDGCCPIFVYGNQDFINSVCRSDGRDAFSNFDRTLRSGWTERMRSGFFRYHLCDLETRILPGPSRFVAQLNILRGKERRKPQEILSIRQDFDAKQFNFNKINPNQIMFEMYKQVEPARDKPMDTASRENGSPGENCKVIINVSPLEFGHSLLVPEPTSCHTQILTPSAVRIGIESVLLSSDPGFRVGFNSLGAFASVNHLHLHGYYLEHELQVESAPAEPLIPERGLHSLIDFPTGFLFYTEGNDVGIIVSDICQLTDFLLDGNIAHNMFITRGCPPDRRCQQARTGRGVRVIVWPRVSCFGAKEETAFNVALCELAGHLPFKNREDFDNITEDGVKSIIQKYLLPDEEFLQLQRQLIASFQERNVKV